MNDGMRRALRPVKRRIRRNRFLRGAAAGLAAGLAAAAALQAVSFLMPVPDRGLWAAAVIAAVTAAVAAACALRPVRDTAAAKAADACGLKERAITALEEGDGPMMRLQREDARKALEGLDVRQIRPGSVRKQLIAATGCAAVLAALLLAGSPQDPAAEARKALAKTLSEGRQTIAQAAEEDREKLPEEKQSELRKITADLDRELERSRDAADALVALDKAEQRLEQMRRQTAGEVSDAAKAGTGTSDGNAEKAAGQEGSTQDGSGTQAASGQASAEAAAMPAGQMKTAEALATLKSAVSPALQKTGTPAQNGQPGTQAGTQGAAGAGMTGNNAGQGGMTGAAGGNNQNGRAGGGAGEGTTNEEQQGGGNSSSGMTVRGTREARYKETEYETIYDPEHIAKEKQDVMTEQFRMGDEGSAQIETGPGKGNTAGDVPWGDVLQEYADTEAQAADRENLTMKEKQWVNEYYRLLTEQQ